MDEFAVLIVAGGTGSRAGNGLPKQYRTLNGKPVLRRTVEAFLSVKGCREIRVVIHPDHLEFYKVAVSGLQLGEPVMGGNTRQESVAKGLAAFKYHDEFPVLIHDAARPFIERATIENCVAKLRDYKAVTVAVPVTDTLRRGERILDEVIDRKDLWSVQTPQGFHLGVIRKAHETLKGDFTDDSQMASAMGIPVAIVIGKRSNIKLTTEEDFATMGQSRITKTGLGYDIHAFGENSDRIRMGGIDIPHTRKLRGHSDADIVLHTITDAILGTIASGDIGSHFPPSDMKFKNMDSSLFVKEALAELKAAGGEIVHIDTVIICEEPKIGPHRDKIRESIATICAIPVKSVSVKAGTSEGLGFVGRREGIACQTLVTIEIDR